jgi:hypothetical protein
MRQGLIIDYRITLYRVPIPWQSVIDVWTPGECFVDRQTVGPYRWWRHEHRFEAAPDGGTRVVDHVEYVPRARWISGRIVSRDLGTGRPRSGVCSNDRAGCAGRVTRASGATTSRARRKRSCRGR